MPHQGQKSLLKTSQRFIFELITPLCLTLAAPVSAQDKSNNHVESLKATVSTPPSEGLNFNLPASSDFTTQTGPKLDLSLDAVTTPVFALDLTSTRCAVGGDGCGSGRDDLNLGLTDTFRRHSEKGLDLSLTPRASMSFSNDLSVKTVGAMIEIGEDLREGSEFKSNTWYFFAGADAEALTYSPNSVGRITSGQFHLQDRIIVGDAQAGLGYRIGDADVSLSYMRREASGEEYKFVEDAAALSFTWKR